MATFQQSLATRSKKLFNEQKQHEILNEQKNKYEKRASCK